MERIIKMHDKLGSFVIGEMINHQHIREREVYFATDDNGRQVMLIVFNLQTKRYSSNITDNNQISDYIEEGVFLRKTKILMEFRSFLIAELMCMKGII